MSFEKSDNCPDCRKELSQREYDGQFCTTCDTVPYDFKKKPPRKMIDGDLYA